MISATPWPPCYHGRRNRPTHIDDTLTGFLTTAAALVEDLLNWEFTVASARALLFAARQPEPGEDSTFHAEDTIRLCQM